jgi:hypothetical protein
MEELILINPMAYIYHLRYGEILLSIGGVEKGEWPECLSWKEKGSSLPFTSTASVRRRCVA